MKAMSSMTEFVFMWRITIITLNLWSLLVLFNRFRKFRHTWKPETRDYWWTLVLWSTAAAGIVTQGLIERNGLTARLVFVTVASLATPMALRRKTRERSYLD